MINEIVYDSLFLTFEVDKEVTTDSITAYSYDGDNFEFNSTSGGTGEYSVIFIN